MDIIVISDDEDVSVEGSPDSDDEPIVDQIARLARKRPGGPIIIELSDEEDEPGPSRPSTDREVSPFGVDLDKVRLPSSDDESDDELFDSALALRSPNNMIPG